MTEFTHGIQGALKKLIHVIKRAIIFFRESKLFIYNLKINK